MRKTVYTIGLLSVIVITAQAQFSGGSGTYRSPYQIANATDLAAITGSYITGTYYFIQTANITLSGNWTPIGGSTSQFNGYYNGNGKTISSLSIVVSTQNRGLFCQTTATATISNLGLTGVSVTGTAAQSGALVGVNRGTITNCYSTGAVAGGNRTGGLVGYNLGGTILNSYTTCDITGSSRAGGLIGHNTGPVTNCYATSDVSATSLNTGGLIGENTGPITGCYADGIITGTTPTGGLLGYNTNVVKDSYSSGSVEGTLYIGGFVGNSSSSANISKSYSTANVSSKELGSYGGGFLGTNGGTVSDCFSYGTIDLPYEEFDGTYGGGFVAENSGTISESYTRTTTVNAEITGGFCADNLGTINNSFWDSDISNATDNGEGTAETTANMQDIDIYTAVGWLFDCETWGINGTNNGLYPFLLWQNSYGYLPNDCNYWTGSSSTSWSTTGNWSGGVPSSGTNVLIRNVSNDPIVGSTVSVGFVNVGTGALLTVGSAGDFTFTDRLLINGSVAVDPGGKLTATGTVENNKSYDGLVIKSTSSGSGSIILSTANVPATIERYAAGTQAFHLISTPVSGQSIRGFLNENSSVLAYNSTNNVYAMRHYIAGTGWASFYPPTQTGNVEPATTYAVGLASTGTLKFKGNLVTTNQTKSISDTGFGWNGIGNPFPSALNARVGASSFLTKYGDQLNSSYYGIYIWDPTNSLYQVINGVPLLSQDYVASAQGFIVKAKTGGGSVIFETGMRAHQNPTFYKNEEEVDDWSNIILQVQNQSGKTLRTSFAFNQEMTSDLDVGFDAGLYTESTTYKFFSRMPGEKNDLDLTIQALPSTWEELVVLPLGLVYSTGGEVVFSIASMSLPEDILVKLEDKTLGTLTDLLSEDYTVTVEESTNSTDRFYLHVVKKTTSLIDIDELNASINVFPNPSNGVFKANILLSKPSDIEIALYDISGRMVLQMPRTQIDIGLQTLTIDSQNLYPGIYVMKVKGFEIGSDLILFDKGIKVVIRRN